MITATLSPRTPLVQEHGSDYYMTTTDTHTAASDGAIRHVPLVKVSSSSPPQKVAGIIAKQIQAPGSMVKVRAIGASAVNQAVKACAIASGYVAPRGITLVIRPSFETVEGDVNPEASAIALIVVGIIGI